MKYATSIHMLPFFLLLALFFPLTAGRSQSGNMRSDAKGMFYSQRDDNLCVAYALYLGLKFHGGENVPYQTIIDTFPNIEEKGANLEQTKNYLESQGFVCHFYKGRLAELLKLKKDVLLFLLRESDDPSKISHVFFARSLRHDTFQIFNFPEGEQKVKKEDLRDVNVFCLLAAKDAELLPAERFFQGKALYMAWALLFAVALSSILIFKRKKNRRKKGQQ
jgi:hypothetical protein